MEKLNYFDLPVLFAQVRNWKGDGESGSVYSALWKLGKGALADYVIGDLGVLDTIPDEFWKNLVEEQWIEEAKRGVRAARTT